MFKRLSTSFSRLNRLLEGFVINPTIRDSGFKTYRKEVQSDLEALREIAAITPYRFEKEQYFIFKDLVEKYQKDYCPSKLRAYFTFDEQAEYLLLRAEIESLI